MSELPDLVVYLNCLAPRVPGRTLERIRIVNPFVLRSWDPPVAKAEGRHVVRLDRLGKRLVVGLEDDLYLVLHLMIAGRLRWRAPGGKFPRAQALAAFEFPTGTLVLTEAESTRRASVRINRLDAEEIASARSSIPVDPIRAAG